MRSFIVLNNVGLYAKLKVVGLSL